VGPQPRLIKDKALEVADDLDARSDEEAVDEVAGREARVPCPEAFSKRQLGAEVLLRWPKCFVFNDVEAEVHVLGAILFKNFAVHDSQAVRCQKNVRSRPWFAAPLAWPFSMGSINFLVFVAGEILFLEPVDDREEARGLQKFSRRRKRTLRGAHSGRWIPQTREVEFFLEMHCFSVHQEKLSIQPLPSRSVDAIWSCTEEVFMPVTAAL